MELELASTRFAFWSLSMIVMITWASANVVDWRQNDTWALNPTQITILGAAIAAFGLGMKEHWWWTPEHLRVVGGCVQMEPLKYLVDVCRRADWYHKNAHYTNFAYAFMFLGEILALNIFTRRFVGRYWFPATCALVGFLYAVSELLIWAKVGV